MAFALGYLIHLLADIVPRKRSDGELQPDQCLWPVRLDEEEYEAGFRGKFLGNTVECILWVSGQTMSDDLDPYLIVRLDGGVFGLLLWVSDGMPLEIGV